MKEAQIIQLKTRIVALESDVRQLAEDCDQLTEWQISISARLDAMEKILRQYTDKAPLVRWVHENAGNP